MIAITTDEKRKRIGFRKRIAEAFRSKSNTSLDSAASSQKDCKSQDEDGLDVVGGERGSNTSLEDITSETALYYWPKEALPNFCPGARILTWGYDSHVTKGFHGPSNKSSVYQHGKDFLYGLSRLGSAPRPIVLITHSLGGIVTKEMLSQSNNSSDSRIKAVVKSTAAVVFLGTPHRGSQWAKLGDTASRILKSSGMDTNSALLDALGLKTSDLQRSQDSFSAVWNTYALRVKTFQEGQGLKGTSLGGLNNKVVDDFSSSLGDEREHAEVLNANHRDMCRFSDPRDSNLVKILAEIADICNFSLQFAPQKPPVSEQQDATVADIHEQERTFHQTPRYAYK